MEKLVRFLRSPISIGIFILLVAFVGVGLYIVMKKKPVSLPLFPKEVAAIVNGKEISKNVFDERVISGLVFLSIPEPGHVKETILEELIQEILLTDFLVEYEIIISEEDLQDEILLEVLRRNVVENIKTKKHVFAIWVEKNEVEFAAEYPPEEEKRIQEVNAPKRAKAEDILRRAEQGEDFSYLARELSEDPRSAERDGDLGFLFIPDNEVPVNYSEIYGEEAATFTQEIIPPEESGTGTPSDYPQLIVTPPPSIFPAMEPLFDAVRELEAGEVVMGEIFTGYYVIKVTEVKEGPLGAQNFSDWYQSLRQQADVAIQPGLLE